MRGTKAEKYGAMELLEKEVAFAAAKMIELSHTL